jgi:hypothetical protein
MAKKGRRNSRASEARGTPEQQQREPEGAEVVEASASIPEKADGPQVWQTFD